MNTKADSLSARCLVFMRLSGAFLYLPTNLPAIDFALIELCFAPCTSWAQLVKTLVSTLSGHYDGATIQKKGCHDSSHSFQI